MVSNIGNTVCSARSLEACKAGAFKELLISMVMVAKVLITGSLTVLVPAKNEVELRPSQSILYLDFGFL